MSDTPKTWFDAISALAFAGICAGMIGVMNRIGEVSLAVVRLESQLEEVKTQLAKSDGYEARLTAVETKLKIMTEKSPP
jgi:hypothetical protein